MTMRNDATRLRIAAKDQRRARAVVSRQGQVLLDTDFDQQSLHQLERIETETIDSLGAPGRLVVPAGNNGFKITPSGAPANFDIAAGRGYLDGWLLENTAICKLPTQPHPRTGDPVSAPAIIAIKALVLHIDPTQEPIYADVALGDAQASGRALNDWQVFPLAVSGGAAIACATALTNPDWVSLVAPSTGTLAVIPQAAAPSTDPCSLAPGGGYTRLENLLYRVEVHGGVVKAGFPTIDGPRFNLHNLKLKFSRRNASVMARIVGIAGAEITVSPPALDARNWFAPGLWAEIVSVHDDVDPRAALANERLFPVALATDDRVVLQATAAQVNATAAADDGTWFLRLWDALPNGDGILTVSAPGGAAESAEIDLGDGIKIKLGNGGSTGTFRRGDFWTCAARASGSIDWPSPSGVAQPMRPHGPEIRYAPLAALTGTSAAPTFEDCRVPFATLTDRALLYRGGDGQGVFAPAGSTMAPLPATLRVAVMRGETPVPGARIRWSFVGPTGSGSLIGGALCNSGNSPETLTDANGLSEVIWSIDGGKPLDVHQVRAAIVTGAATTSVPPIVFTASFEAAAHTGYTPGKCAHLAGIDNVQDALDGLCAKIGDDDKHEALTLTSILLIGDNGNDIELIREDFILNALDVPYTSIIGGIAFGLDGGIPDIAVAPYDPVVEVELDLPYPMTDPDKLYWARASQLKVDDAFWLQDPFAFQRIRLDGEVKVVPKGPNGLPGLLWTLSDQAMKFLTSAPGHLWGQVILNTETGAELKRIGWGTSLKERILCRIRLRSAMIWVEDKEKGERIYLNAEHLGVVGPATGRELLVKERDPQRAGDLDMFVYLVPRGFKSKEKFPLKPQKHG